MKALHPATAKSAEDSLSRAATENAPRVAALVARAIRAREPSMLDDPADRPWPMELGQAFAAAL